MITDHQIYRKCKTLDDQMTEELRRIDMPCNDKPEGFGRTLLVRPTGIVSPGDLLQRVRSVWRVVAGWGRYCDEDLGEFPDAHQAIAQFPDWFQKKLREASPQEIENFLDDADDRNWIWWSSSTLVGGIRIDLSASSLPIGIWIIDQFVLHKCGGQSLYRDDWLSTEQAIERISKGT
jgi:hypothetical protein